MLSHPSIDGPTAVLTTVAAGGIGSLLALLALTVDETDEAFANIYSTAVSIQNLVPRASQRLLIVGVAVAATAISLGVDLRRYQDFLLLLGAFFVPLFGVLLADWLVAGRHYGERDVFSGPAWRPGMIAAWLAGLRALRVPLARRARAGGCDLIHHRLGAVRLHGVDPELRGRVRARRRCVALVARRRGVLAPRG